MAQAVAGRSRLLSGEFRAQHDIAQHGRSRFGGVGATTRLELVHREAHHVGRPGKIHPAHV
ncbi:Uncharacterised protein [Mycobacterium tuberculosis]|uniref:Uncharacterized protein n=1 Tax=Mycobacterium tuberculosis TaxID=1773 RepID=A0A916LH62_MYCTX|nr:Uncharacterised protein [Mycobacterium tuberculosis]